MSDVMETHAGTAADLYPWPRSHTDTPVCSRHDPELWFPDDQSDYAEAVALCRTCPLIDLCRDVAVTRKETGIWGGLLFKNGRTLDGFPQPGRPRKANRNGSNAA